LLYSCPFVSIRGSLTLIPAHKRVDHINQAAILLPLRGKARNRSGSSLFVGLTFFGSFMRHTLSVLVENKFGVLNRITNLFSGRGFNIDTLNVGPTEDPATSRMTIVVVGDDKVLVQVTKQLNRLVEV